MNESANSTPRGGEHSSGEMALARVLTVAGLKGGLGRTTLAVNVAALMALSGRKILLIDLDPTGSATAALGLPRDDRNDRMPAFAKQKEFEEHLVRPPEVPNLSIWPGGAMLNEIEARLWNMPDAARDQVLDKSLARARSHFDLIVIDAPASQGPLSRNAMSCADDLLLPVRSQGLDCITIERTVDLVNDIRSDDAPPLRIFAVRFGRCANFGVSELKATCRDRVMLLDYMIVDDHDTVTQAHVDGQALIHCAPKSRLTRSYVEVCRELMGHLFESGSLTTRLLSLSARG